MNPPTHEFVVVGAGPAGALAALGLARRGREVLLLDREARGRDKLCGGCLHPRAVRLLQGLGLSEVLDAALPLRRCEILRDGRRAQLDLPLGLVVSRTQLDEALIGAAERAGATYRERQLARLATDTGAGARRLSVAEETLRAECVIAADGLVSSTLAVDRGPSRATPGAHIGAGAWIAADDAVSIALPEATVLMAIGDAGYVGAVRLPDGRLDVAAALAPTAIGPAGGVAALVDDLLREQGAAQLAALAATADWQLTPPLTRRDPRPWSRRLFAVGDAAGFVEPFTGEGMAWALSSGEQLATLLAAARGASLDNPRLGHAWARRASRELGSSRRRCALVARGLRHPSLVGAAVSLMSRAPWLGRALLSWGHGR